MHLLASLNAGFLGAANGTAELYIRGTNTRATWYASFEGDGPNSSGADITLDAYGSALVYVNQLVDVVVKDADGVSVRDYGDGYASPNIEVISQSFTGTDYTGGGSAASKPTTLQAIEDLWKTNNGAIDWKVLFQGAATTLQVALGGLTGLVYNVKSPAYGAKGDNVTDDLTAIQAALAAAVAAGGGVVFFPTGNYLISDTITWDYRIHAIFMPGAQLLINSAASKTIKFTAANTTTLTTVFYGATFGAAQNNTGVVVSLEASQKLYFEKCVFGISSLTSGTLMQASSSQVSTILHDCEFYLTGTAANAFKVTTGSPGYFLARDNKFVTPAVYNATVIDMSSVASAYTAELASNVFDGVTNATTTAGTNMCARLSVFGNAVIDNNRLLGNFTYGLFLEAKASVVANEFSGTGTAVECDGGNTTVVGNLFKSSTVAVSASASTYARGNTFESVTTRYSGAGFVFAEMDPKERVTGSGTAYSVSANVSFTELVSSGANPTITMPNGVYPGQPRQIHFRNTSGGNWAGVVFTGASVIRTTGAVAVAVPVVNAGLDAMTSFIWTDPVTPGTYVWLTWNQT